MKTSIINHLAILLQFNATAQQNFIVNGVQVQEH
jgi:hypothetical protein